MTIRFIIQILCAIGISAILTSVGLGVSTWQWWTVIFIYNILFCMLSDK